MLRRPVGQPWHQLLLTEIPSHALFVYAHQSIHIVHPGLFKDRNFLASNVFIFLVGVVLFATLALLPLLLQNQL